MGSVLPEATIDGVDNPARWALPSLRVQDLDGETSGEGVDTALRSPLKRYGSGKYGGSHAVLLSQRSFRSGPGSLSAQASFTSLRRLDRDNSQASLASAVPNLASAPAPLGKSTSGTNLLKRAASWNSNGTIGTRIKPLGPELSVMSASAMEALDKAQVSTSVRQNLELPRSSILATPKILTHVFCV
jgi:hypothetical protein